MRENRETSSSSTGQRRACWEGYKPKPTMNDDEESDNSIVPTKRLNKIKENYGGNRGGKGVDQGECDST